MAPLGTISEIAANPEGLYELQTGTSNVRETKYDLVAVHGLAGDAASTWRHDNGSLWFDWLTSAQPAVRVLIFGYPAASIFLRNADLTGSTQRMFTLAEQLCVRLLAVRSEKSNPITFLGHGVGGILIKAALIHCKRLDIYHEILQSTHHVVFLDTPHLGFDKHEFTAIFGTNPTEEAQRQFRLWSTTLHELCVTFGNITSETRIHFTTSQSTEPFTTPAGALVAALPPGVTDLYATTHENHLHPFEVSHLSISRFPTKDDFNYRQLESEILAQMKLCGRPRISTQALNLGNEPTEAQLRTLSRRTTSDLRRHMQKGEDSIEAPDLKSRSDELGRQRETNKAQRAALLDWLWPNPIRDANNQVTWQGLEKHSNALEDTCDWLCKHPGFIAWKKSGSSQMAFLHGLPASGKSTLLAYLVKQTQQEAEPMAYWFCDSQSHSTVTALKSIAYQLMERADDETVIRVLSPFRDQMPRGVALSSMAASMLKNVLMSFLSTILIVDALDEATAMDDQDTQPFLYYLQQVVREIPLGVKIFCSSRRVRRVLRAMESMGSAKIDIPLTRDLIEQDLKKVIKHHMIESELWDRLKTDVVVRDFVMSNLVSCGIFLLPIIMIKDLKTRPQISDIYSFFDQFPENRRAIDYQKYYLSLVSRIDTTRLGFQDGEYEGRICPGQKLLTWLLWSKSVLTVEQLEEAMTLDGTEFVDLVADVQDAFGCLVEVVDGTIQISHPSIRRFLLESSVFRESKWHKRLIMPDPHHYIGRICVEYMLRCHFRLAFKGGYLSPRKVMDLKAQSPFLEYACVNWLFHWQEAQSPQGFVDYTWRLICDDDSKNFFRWEVAAVYFLSGEPFYSLVYTLESLINKLCTMSFIHGESEITKNRIADAQNRLRLLKRFVALWGTAVIIRPFDISSLFGLIPNPYRCTKSDSVQKTLLIPGQARFTPTGRPRALLDRRRIDTKYERFILSKTGMFLWQSLMPCFSHYCRLGYPLDTDFPHGILLRQENILHDYAQPVERIGLEMAAAGSLMACCVLARDWKHVAIAWPSFSSDKALPLRIKTYVFSVTPGEDEDRLDGLNHVPWTEAPFGDDPCRADLTSSNVFRNSRGVVAFTSDSKKLWTCGGLYDLETGHHTPPPRLFRDSLAMSELTISRYGDHVAGIRGAGRLELHELESARCQLLASTPGASHIMAVSPLGKYVLFLAEHPADAPPRPEKEASLVESFPVLDAEICLLDDDGMRTTLWQYITITEGEVDEEDLKTIPSLEFFYNNGGLQAFSDDDGILILYIPTIPDRQLLLFDLKADDIAASASRLDFLHLFDGADIVSFSFSATSERQICLLDCLGNMRTLEIVPRVRLAESGVLRRMAGETATFDIPVSVVQSGRSAEHAPILCYGSVCATKKDWTDMSLEAVKGFYSSERTRDCSYNTRVWNLETFEEIPKPGIDLSFLRYLLAIQSRNLMADPHPVTRTLQFCGKHQSHRASNWAAVARAAQRAIRDTIEGNREVFEALGIADPKTIRDEGLTRVSTMVSFNDAVTTAFFQSLIFQPILPEKGQPMWSVSMIVDVRYFDTPRARKTGAWRTSTAGTVYYESLALAYDDHTKMLAYSGSLLWENRARPNARNWAMTRLCLCAVSEQPYERRFVQMDERGTFLESEVYNLEEECITALTFSPCGRYLYGICEGPDCKGTFIFDVLRGYVMRKVVMTDLYATHMTFLSPQCQLQLFQQHQQHEQPQEKQKGQKEKEEREEQTMQLMAFENVEPVQISVPVHSGKRPLKIRSIALGPRALDSYGRVDLLVHHGNQAAVPGNRASGWTFTTVASLQTYLRKEGEVGGENASRERGPAVLSRREEYIGAWTEVGDTLAEDVTEDDNYRRGGKSPKTELREDYKQLCEAFEKWERRRKLSAEGESKEVIEDLRKGKSVHGDQLEDQGHQDAVAIGISPDTFDQEASDTERDDLFLLRIPGGWLWG